MSVSESDSDETFAEIQEFTFKNTVYYYTN